MSNHTPGQWETSRDAVPEGHVQITVYAADTGRRVATAFENEGNARLIAAAPKMLEALQAAEGALDSMLDREDNPGVRAIRKMVLAAIAEATS
jgi:hypothetical protein